MDKIETTAALIPNVRLKYHTCDVTNYKNETRVINKCGKQNQNIPTIIAMKEMFCFGSSKLSLSL